MEKERPIQIAEYRSRCVACDDDIQPGELISPNDDEEWCHAGDCADE